MKGRTMSEEQSMQERAEVALAEVAQHESWAQFVAYKTPSGQWELRALLSNVASDDFFVLGYLSQDTLNNIRVSRMEHTGQPTPLPLARHLIDPTIINLPKSIVENGEATEGEQ